MNVRKRSGAMGSLTTTQKADPSPQVQGALTQRGDKYKGSVAIAIENSVAVKPRNVGPSKVDNAVSWPGKF